MNSVEPEEEDLKKNVKVVISSLGNERRTVHLGECSIDEIKGIMGTIEAAFHVVRVSQSLLLTGTDGITVFANLDNIAFVEVQIA